MAGAIRSDLKAIDEIMIFALRESDVVVTSQAADTRRSRRGSEGN